MKKILTISLLSATISTTSLNVISCNNFNVKNNKITNFDPLLNTSDYLDNATDSNFTLIMENDNFNSLISAMQKNKDVKADNTEKIFDQFFPKANKKPNLDDATWNKIYSDFYSADRTLSIGNDYVGIIEIDNGKFIYANTKTDATSNIKTINEKPKLKINKLITSAIPKEISNNEIKILFNENMLLALNNAYSNNKWTTDNIKKILTKNNFQYSDNKSDDVINAIYNWFKTNYDNVKTYLNKPELNNGTLIKLN